MSQCFNFWGKKNWGGALASLAPPLATALYLLSKSGGSKFMHLDRIALHYVNASSLSRYHRILRDITSRAVPNVSQINNNECRGTRYF